MDEQTKLELRTWINYQSNRLNELVKHVLDKIALQAELDDSKLLNSLLILEDREYLETNILQVLRMLDKFGVIKYQHDVIDGVGIIEILNKDYFIFLTEIINNRQSNQKHGFDIDIDSQFPTTSRYKPAKRMAKMLITGNTIKLHTLARCFAENLTERRFNESPKSYTEQIWNRMKTVKKYIKLENSRIVSIKTPEAGYRIEKLREN
jgi:hypothetical protein